MSQIAPFQRSRGRLPHRSLHHSTPLRMTTFAHALSGGIIAVTAAQVAPSESGYIAAALLAGAIADLDHLAPVVREWGFYREHGFRGNLHAARTPLHELVGLTLAGIVGSFVWIADPRLAVVIFAAFAVHLAEDFVVGRSLPFNPVDRTEVQMFALGFREKASIDVVTIIVSTLLWIAFLSGRL